MSALTLSIDWTCTAHYDDEVTQNIPASETPWLSSK